MSYSEIDMKNIVIAFGYLIMALLFDSGIFMLNRVRPSSRFASFVGRALEGMGNTMAAMQKKMQES